MSGFATLLLVVLAAKPLAKLALFILVSAVVIVATHGSVVVSALLILAMLALLIRPRRPIA
jgi:hypothetical protein